MNIHLSQYSNVFFKFAVFIVFISFVKLAHGQESKITKDQNNLVISPNKGTKFYLEVSEQSLSTVLKNISIKSNVPIHYSVLPTGLVTATCVGPSLKQVLECLLDRKADLIVRYINGTDKMTNNEQIAEAWILGSTLGNTMTQNDCPRMTGLGKEQFNFEQNQVNAEFDQTDDLVKLAQSEDSATRVEAISELLANGRPGDPTVKATLERALTDKDDNVRAQAISTLAHREGNGAIQAIQEAMHDHSVDVRTMAVDSIIDDTALLQQAINDSDETIRILATVKLEALTQSTNIKP